MTHYFSLFNFLMANWNWAVVLVVFVVFAWLVKLWPPTWSAS